MEGRTMRILSEYIADIHRRDREYYRTTERTSIHPEEDSDTNRFERNRSGDDGCRADSTGQGRDNL